MSTRQASWASLAPSMVTPMESRPAYFFMNRWILGSSPRVPLVEMLIMYWVCQR
jgi:hypothetical protein